MGPLIIHMYFVCSSFPKGIISLPIISLIIPAFFSLWEFSVLVRIFHLWVKPPLRSVCVFASPRRVFLVFLQQWHGGVILPRAGEQPQCSLCRLSLRHCHCRREWRDPDEREVPPHVARQHRSVTLGDGTSMVIKIQHDEHKNYSCKKHSNIYYKPAVFTLILNLSS